MTFREIRNTVVSELSAYLGIPVALANQVNPEQDYPFVIYSVTTPYIPENTLGEYRWEEGMDGTAEEIRREQPTCTWSFTVCSTDRGTEAGYILGEDEALELAEKALGWFLHAGYDDISRNGITVVDAGNVQERSVLQVDEEARRYGFDVTIRYAREDKRKVRVVEKVTAIERGEET